MSQQLEQVIAAFAATKSTGKEEWKGKCPLCGHHSLLIKPGDKQPVMAWCSLDCDKKAVNAAVYKVAGPGDTKPKPFTVARFCEMKKLPLAWVTAHFLLHDTYKSPKGERTACGFPYLGHAQVTTTEKNMHMERPFGGLKWRWRESLKDKHATSWQDYTRGDGKHPMLYGLHMRRYYEDNFIDTDVVVLCEGESDTITLAYKGIPAFGVPGAPHGWNNEFAKEQVLQDATRILVIQEPDGAGTKFTEKIAASFPAGKVLAVKLPVKDPSDLWINSKNDEEFDAAWTNAVAAAQPVVFDSTPYVVERMSDVVPVPITWLWPGRIPAGKVTMFAGNPGTGKSLVTCNLASIVTTGGMFPDEASARAPGDVLMFFCEDDAGDTVKPRLMASGANCKRISMMKHKPDASDTKQELSLDSDLKLIEDFLLKNPNVKLVTIDPITSYVGDVRTENEKEVRKVLMPVAELAKKTGVAFVLLAHFNKRADVNALQKVMGAVAMTGIARAVWMFAEDTDAPEGMQRNLMLPGKMSLGKRMKGLEYTIEEKQVLSEGNPSPYVKWGNATDVTAEKAFGSIGAFGDQDGSKVKLAGEWLAEFLGTESKRATDVFESGIAAGHAEKTLRRAAEEIGVFKSRMLGKSIWRMPADSGSDETEAAVGIKA